MTAAAGTSRVKVRMVETVTYEHTWTVDELADLAKVPVEQVLSLLDDSNSDYGAKSVGDSGWLLESILDHFAFVEDREWTYEAEPAPTS